MSIIARYVRWLGHDAGGTLPPEDVLAGVLIPGSCALPAELRELAGADGAGDADNEVLVVVPPQWIGDWISGHRLAPGYQYVWRVPARCLEPLPATPRVGSYRPEILPASATGPRSRRVTASR